jgi:hypothetical protein
VHNKAGSPACQSGWCVCLVRAQDLRAAESCWSMIS